MKTSHPAKHSCIESPEEEADLQAEANADANYQPPYADEPCSDCESTYLGSTSSLSSTSTPMSSKQSRRFKKDWLTGRQHWLQYKHEIRGMFCLLCQKFNKRPFSNEIWNSLPCTRLRLQRILTHERSAAHQDAIKLAAAAAASENIVSPLNCPVSEKGIEQAFCCLYFLTKQKIAHTTNYEPLLDLVGLLGVDVKSSEMTESEHFSLMLDETTDCSITEQLAIHGRYISRATGELKSGNNLKIT